MPFKDHATKAQAMLGAKDYLARVERNEGAYCAEGWIAQLLASAYYSQDSVYYPFLSVSEAVERLREVERPVGCILTEAALAVVGDMTLLKPDPSNPTAIKHAVTKALGILSREMCTVIEAHDDFEDKHGNWVSPQARVRLAYERLAAIPVQGDDLP